MVIEGTGCKKMIRGCQDGTLVALVAYTAANLICNTIYLYVIYWHICTQIIYA